jgi:hypothetical protein
MSKGSRPRPYSVSQAEFANNYDVIFGKKKDMSPSVEQMKKGTCGCGRSPTGNCIGWHGLTEAEFQSKLALYLADEQAKQIDNDQEDK